MTAVQEWIVAVWEAVKAVSPEVAVAAVLLGFVVGMIAIRVWRIRNTTTPEQREQWAREERARRRRATVRRSADAPYHVRRRSDAVTGPIVVDSTPADSGPCSDGGSGGGGGDGGCS